MFEPEGLLQIFYNREIDRGNRTFTLETMSRLNRRKFLYAGVSVACASDLGCLNFLSHAAASDTRIDPNEIVYSPEMDRLVGLIRKTPKERCIEVFLEELKSGLSYAQFLGALFLAALETRDPHQVAQVYAAHRTSNEAPVEERLLPLFWVLHRIKQEHDFGSGAVKAAVKKPKLQGSANATLRLREALMRNDREEAQVAAVALAELNGPWHAMEKLWEFAGRNLGGNLGHVAIALANSMRTLDTMGWQHADLGLRYVAGYVAGYEGDKTYARNLELSRKSKLPEDWTSARGDRGATLELFNVLRGGNANGAAELACEQLSGGKVKAGAVWDAINLAAADSIFRFRTGGEVIGGVQVHAVTTTNALRFGFELNSDPQTRLLLLLQAAGVTADFFIGQNKRDGNLRDLNLVELRRTEGKPPEIAQVFALLPMKAKGYNQLSPSEREGSDAACRMAFEFLRSSADEAVFMRTARSFLCRKASLDPHDVKFPAAMFEDVLRVSPEWRPYLLASSVHALHGPKSADSPTLAKVREALC
jgi:hypothetical protein